MTFRTLGSLRAQFALLLTALLLASCVATPLRRRPRDVDVPGVVQLELFDFGGHPLVEVFIDGHGPFRLLPDTGSEVTILSPRVASGLPGKRRMHSLRLGGASTVRSARVQLIEIDEMRLGAATLGGFEALIYDLPGGIDGLIGMALFDGMLMQLDGPGGWMRLRYGSLPEPDGSRILSWDSGTVTPQPELTLCGRPFQALLDTGFNGWLFLPRELQADLPFAIEPTVRWQLQDLLEHDEALLGRLDGRLYLGDASIDQPDVLVGTGRSLVGWRVLSSFVLTCDVAQRRIAVDSPLPRAPRIASKAERRTTELVGF